MQRRVPVTGKRESIKQCILDYIQREGLKPGDLLPSQNQLAQTLKVMPLTTHRAMTELAEEGVIYRVRGKGSFLGPNTAQSAQRPVCMVVPDLGLDQPALNPTHWEYVDRLLKSCLQACGSERNFSILCIPEKSDPMEQIKRITPGTIVFFCFHVAAYRPLLELFRENKSLIAVSLGYFAPDLPCLNLGYQRASARRLAAHYLAANGYRKTCFLSSNAPWDEGDYGAFASALTEAGLPVAPKFVVSDDESLIPDAFIPAMQQIIHEGYEAIVARTDTIALPALEYLRREGVAVPGQVGVMGFEALPRATEFSPYLTSVRPPYAELIRAALERIQNSSREDCIGASIELPAQIVPGQTILRRV